MENNQLKDSEKIIKAKLGLIMNVLLNPVFPGGNVVEPAKIKYEVLQTNTLEKLEQAGVPASSGAPFNFDFQKVLESDIVGGVDKALFLNALVDLFYREWNIWKGRSLFTPHEPRAIMEKRAKEILKSKMAEKGFQAQDQRGRVVDVTVMQQKWILDDLVIRLRAMWEAQLNFLSERVMLTKLDAEKFAKRVKTFEENHKDKPFAKEFLQLVPNGENDWLTKYRTQELHKISTRVIGALEHDSTDKYVADYWHQIVQEHNRTREGLMVVISTVLFSGSK
ncbi:MAG: hypothetical protein AAB488_00730 [Patescibacteria group bacterium]